jgi:hypothetical protein
MKKRYKGWEDEDVKKTTGWPYGNKKTLGIARDHPLWRTRFGHVVRQNK